MKLFHTLPSSLLLFLLHIHIHTHTPKITHKSLISSDSIHFHSHLHPSTFPCPYPYPYPYPFPFPLPFHSTSPVVRSFVHLFRGLVVGCSFVRVVGRSCVRLLFVRLFVCSSVRSFVRSFVCSLVRSFARPSVRSFCVCVCVRCRIVYNIIIHKTATLTLLPVLLLCIV